MIKKVVSIKCSNKKCGHTNAGGSTYCVKCGQLLGGKQERIVVIKCDYDEMDTKIKDFEQDKKKFELEKRQLEDRLKTLTNTDKVRVEQIQRLQSTLDDIKKNGFAPRGFHLVVDSNVPEWRRGYKEVLDRIDFDDKKSHNTEDKIWEIAKDEVLKERSFDFSFLNLKPEDRLKLLREDLKDSIDGTAAQIKKLDSSEIGYKIVNQKTLSNSEYDDLVKRANQTWWQKLWSSIKG